MKKIFFFVLCLFIFFGKNFAQKTEKIICVIENDYSITHFLSGLYDLPYIFKNENQLFPQKLNLNTNELQKNGYFFRKNINKILKKIDEKNLFTNHIKNGFLQANFIYYQNDVDLEIKNNIVQKTKNLYDFNPLKNIILNLDTIDLFFAKNPEKYQNFRERLEYKTEQELFYIVYAISYFVENLYLQNHFFLKTKNKVFLDNIQASIQKIELICLKNQMLLISYKKYDNILTKIYQEFNIFFQNIKPFQKQNINTKTAPIIAQHIPQLRNNLVKLR